MSDLRAAIEALADKWDRNVPVALDDLPRGTRSEVLYGCADRLRDALAAHPEFPPPCWCHVCVGTCPHPAPAPAQPDPTLGTLLRAESARADAAEADARHWRTTALWYGAPDKAARP